AQERCTKMMQPTDSPVQQGSNNRLRRRLSPQGVQVALYDGSGVLFGHGSFLPGWGVIHPRCPTSTLIYMDGSRARFLAKPRSPACDAYRGAASYAKRVVSAVIARRPLRSVDTIRFSAACRISRSTGADRLGGRGGSSGASCK